MAPDRKSKAPTVDETASTIAPDLDALRKGYAKGLKKKMKKYRFSACIPFICVITSFVLSIIVILAGTQQQTFPQQYMVALNTSSLGQDFVKFEGGSSTQPSRTPTNNQPSRTATTAPAARTSFSLLNPRREDVLESRAGNATTAATGGDLGQVLNEVVAQAVKDAGVKDYYVLYLQKICSGSFGNGSTNGTSNGTDNGLGGEYSGFTIDECLDWGVFGDRLSKIGNDIKSSISMGQQNVTIPLLTKLTGSVDAAYGRLSSSCKAVFAFLVISLLCTGLSALGMVPAMKLGKSLLLIYWNLFWPVLGSIFAFLAAVILTVIIVGIPSLIDGYMDTLGLHIKRGSQILIFVWIAWALTLVPCFFWGGVWFVEFRQKSFVKRQRTSGEIGNYKGIKAEFWADLKGKKDT